MTVSPAGGGGGHSIGHCVKANSELKANRIRNNIARQSTSAPPANVTSAPDESVDEAGSRTLPQRADPLLNFVAESNGVIRASPTPGTKHMPITRKKLPPMYQQSTPLSAALHTSTDDP